MTGAIATLKVAVTADLRHCKLFVQLLSGLAGETAEDFRGYPFYQDEIAKPLNRPLFQWRPKDLSMDEADSDRQKELLNLPSVRAEPIDDFKKAVLEAAKAKAAPPSPPKTGASVFVNTDACDWSLADDICQWLVQSGHRHLHADSAGYPGPYRGADHAGFRTVPARLRRPDRRLRRVDRALGAWPVPAGDQGLGSAQPAVVAIYVAPPIHKADHGVRYPGMLPLDCRGTPHQPDEAALARFVAKLKGEPQ